MYHVSNDLRAKKSAELICKGLEKCLEEKPLQKIRISDIYSKSYVSRSTFYRLFDSIEDIFAYECDIIRNETINAVKDKDFKDKNAEVIYCIKLWMKHEALIKAIVENRLIGVLYDSHMRNAKDLKKLYSYYQKDDSEFNYFVSVLVSLIFTALTIYFQNNGEKSVEEIFEQVCINTGIIVENWKKGLNISKHTEKR